MNYTINEVLEFVEDNDVKFVRLVFFDIFGTQKNISILAAELPNAFEKGVNLDVEKIDGFIGVTNSELYLFPDARTLAVLPWRPQHGRVIRLFCDIKYSDGRPFECDVRNVLNNTVKKVRSLGYSCNVSADCEFYLFETDDKGEPTRKPQDYAGYFDMAPLDKGENVRRQICLTLEEMDISPLSSHHECGPGQNKINFKPSSPLSSADHLSTFKMVVKASATSYGLFASFLPKPLNDNPGSALVTKFSLYTEDKKSIFEFKDGVMNPIGQSFAAGVLNRLCDITLFTNPIMNSYARLLTSRKSKNVAWSDYCRDYMVRVPDLNGNNNYIEVSTPDPSCNHYIVFALILSAGCEGIINKEKLQPKSVKQLKDSFNIEDMRYLPDSLSSALKMSKNSEFLKNVLPKQLLDNFINKKSSEIENSLKNTDIRLEQEERYFHIT